MNDFDDEENDKNRGETRQERVDHLADQLVEAARINAWEYGNLGDFLFR